MSHVTKGVCVLGATGSIGSSTLDVIRRHPDQFRLVAATANQGVERMLAICEEFQPRFAVMADEDSADRLLDGLKRIDAEITVLSGTEGLVQVAAHEDSELVMASIVGAAGLESALAAARAGKRVLLANKESLVMTGDLFMAEVAAHGAELLPIDSEHNAIFQCMPGNFHDGLDKVGVRRILLTASGGPFRKTPLSELCNITPEQAVAHPNWDMGRKISVDSATLMNKGLELIEACWLFDSSPDRIEVVVHPQSIIHSMVEYSDGSVLAQMGNPDMRTPIAHAMGWPQRMASGVEPLSLLDVARLDFEAPDEQRFPCLRLAREAKQTGGTACTILNAANEIAVDAFLDERIAFLDIPAVNESTLATVTSLAADSLDAVLDADRAAREAARRLVHDASERFGAVAS